MADALDHGAARPSASIRSYVHIAVHRPRPGKRRDVIASMYRMRDAVLAQPGIIDCFTLADDESDALIGIAIWESHEAYVAARAAMDAAVEGDPFDEWEDAGPEIFRARLA
jgi:heme-degrading monooxygenase HmoA